MAQDYKKNAQLLQEALQADRLLAKMGEYTRKQENAIHLAAEALLQDKVEATLSTIGVEELSRHATGIRVSLLQGAGYHTIWDVLCSSETKLEAVNGIGAWGAHEIYRAANEIRTGLVESTPLRLNADRKTEGEGKLLQLILAYGPRYDVCAKARTMYDKEHDRVMANAKKMKPATGGLRWLFAGSNTKENARAAVSFFEGLHGRGYASATEKLWQRFREAEHLVTLADAWAAFEKDPIPFYTLLEKLGIRSTKGDGVYGLPMELAREVSEVPLDLTGLKCTLRRYQEYGVQYVLNQGSALLGDEMGLGKTIQAIACMVALRNAGKTHFLVVAPASVLVNWCREVPQHSDLWVTEIHGRDMQQEADLWVHHGGVAVTTYETAGRFVLPEDFRIDLLTADEAHYVKNPEANRSRVLLRLKNCSDRVLFMTGTALENHVDEMCQLVSYLQPDTAKRLTNMKALATAPQFREAAAPVYFRRRRDEVLGELPDKIEAEEWLRMGMEERGLYQLSVMASQFAEMRRVSWNVEHLQNSVKAQRLLELCDEAKEQGRKVLVFSFFLKTLEKVQQLLGDRCMGPITGAVAPAKRQELIDDFAKAEPGTVLVSQIQAGGTGLNIQSASVVIFCEPQIKPSLETQAISRAYRMGQAHSVLVYRLLCVDSVDERIMELLREKQEQFDSFAEESVSGKESLEKLELSMESILQQEKKRLALAEEPGKA